MDALRSRREARRQVLRHRRVAAGAFLAALIVVAVILIAGCGGASRSPAAARSAQASSAGAAPSVANHSRGTAASGPGGPPGHAAIPILMYHVIAPPPPAAPFPGLYVPPAQFAEQMHALNGSGWHAVTMDQVAAYWHRGVPLGAGKPIVLTFDNGYHSQYATAMPVLKRLGWVGNENMQLSGLPPSQGGLTDAEVRGLVNAGWELDTQGISHADLIALDATQLHHEVATARQIIRRRYGVPVNWFCYPSGHYNDTVIAAVRAAGYVGSTTVVPGWAGPSNDPYRLPRLRVLGGTSPSALLGQLASTKTASPPPGSYGGAGTA
jgi:peptidoglycan/xylan/chitin deacetylase (PgdA/CDA1 family)